MISEWKRDNTDVQELQLFTRDILPKLQAVSLRDMSRATGLTEGYCSFVRRGLKVPHRRHWQPLAALAATVRRDLKSTERLRPIRSSFIPMFDSLLT